MARMVWRAITPKYLKKSFIYVTNFSMSLSGALSLNVAKKDQKNGEKGLEGHHTKIPQKALQNTSQANGRCNSVKWGSH